MITKYTGFYRIVEKESISPTLFKYTFEAPDIAAKSEPGQFIQARTSNTYFPLWPRPFSIHDADVRKGSLSIMFKVFGGGTSLMATREVGEMIHLLGPLGNAFPVPRPGTKIIMAAGGVGLPPLYFLSKKTIENGGDPRDIKFIAGAKSKDELLEEKGLYDLGVEIINCTDDGSKGIKGNVVETLAKLLGDGNHPTIYACGPNAMLKGVDALISANKLDGHLSLEALMPCGYGICSGCAIKVYPSPDRGPTDDKRNYHLKRVCIEGPIFGAGEVMWDG